MIRVRVVGMFVGAALAAAPVAADVTLKQKVDAKMPMGASMKGDSVQYIKGARMRSDDPTGNSTIIDLDAQQMIVLDPKRREAGVYDMKALAAQIAKGPAADVTARITPTAETRQIAGSSCTVHTMSVSAPMDMGGEPLTIGISGPVCLARSVPGQADFAAFYKAAADKGMFFGDPRAAKAQSGHARGMSALYREMAGLGVPLLIEMNMGFEGTGPMAGMMSKMGRTTMITEVVSISADPIPDAMFEVPAGYKVSKR